MPATLPFNKLPGQEDTTPYSVLNNHLVQLKDTYKGLVSNLHRQKLSGDNYRQMLTAHQNYQEDYNQKKSMILGIKNQLDTIQKLMSEGQLDPVAGNKAMWKAVLPEDVASAMFPTVRKESQFSMAQMKQIVGPEGGIDKAGNDSGIIKVFTRPDNIPVDPNDTEWFTGRANEKRRQPHLVQQYLAAKEETEVALGVPMTNIQQEQFDTAWDFEIKQHPNYEWDPNSGEIQAIRASGKLAQAGGKNITPFGRHIINTGISQVIEKKPQSNSGYTLGQKISKGGRNWVVAGFDADGTPMVEEIQ